jgi:hypothetical protein
VLVDCLEEGRSAAVSGVRIKPIVPVSYQRAQAAAALGVSDDFFDAHIKHSLKTVYIQSLRLYPVTGLQAWVDKHAVGGHDAGTTANRPRTADTAGGTAQGAVTP